MPAKSKAQLRKLFALEAEGKVPEGTGRRWARHTPDIKKLPEHVRKKQAFVASFLLRCAKSGLTTPEQIAVEAEKYAACLEKAAEESSLGSSLLGHVAGLGSLGLAAGVAAPIVAGYAGGRLAGSAHNQIDTDDAESLRIAALANAYRRRAAEAKLNAQVRDFVATDPSKYTVLS